MTDVSKPLMADQEAIALVSGFIGSVERDVRDGNGTAFPPKFGADLAAAVNRLLAMARSSLSGIEAEPVAWIYQAEIDGFTWDERRLTFTPPDPSTSKSVQPLYLSPPTKGGEGRELVEVAKEARKWLAGQPDRATCNYGTLHGLLEALDAAIAKIGATP